MSERFGAYAESDEVKPVLSRGAQSTSDRPSAMRRRGPIIQTKLAVGPADDRFEREADAVADRVVAAIRRPTSSQSGAGRVQRMTGRGVRDHDVGNVAGRIQRMSGVGRNGEEVDGQTAGEIKTASASGSPLPRAIRSTLEPAFGADFSGVRLHAGAQSSALNNRIQAQAFTTGNHVFFRDGLPDMSRIDGQHLLAHELTHTLQQGAAGPRLQRATVIQRFLDPSQAAKLSKARADLAALLESPNDAGEDQRARKQKIDDLRALVDELDERDRVTPAPALASSAPILADPVVKDATAHSAGPSTPTAVPQSEDEPSRTEDPMASKRASMLSDLEAAATARKAARATATRALRNQMPRGYFEASTDIDRIVSKLPSQEVYDDYRSRVAGLEPKDVGGAEAHIARVVEAVSNATIQRFAEQYANWLNQLTVTQVTELVDQAVQGDAGKQKLRNYVLLALGNRLEVGPLRAYYRSKHDKEENATYGMSFDLTNSPLSVHCHTAGSGTQITSVSLKHRDRERGAAVMSESWLTPKLADALVDGIARSAENPRAVILDMKKGTRPAVNWTRAGVR